jgi:hypothetical protein
MFHFCYKIQHTFYALGIMDHLDFILRTQCAVTETISLRPIRLSPQFCMEKDTEPGSKMFRIKSEKVQCQQYKN